ncbi:MAG: hypothetical protein M3N57_13270 [Actinomycetota bacterium]|nr:hypothetical protein [Actinomycetota bacterium]
MVAAAMAATACASPPDTAEERAGPSPPPAHAGDVGPRTIEHAFGTAEVPARPERVVALDPYVSLPTALLADANVVGTAYLRFGEPFPVFLDDKQTRGIEHRVVRRAGHRADCRAGPGPDSR